MTDKQQKENPFGYCGCCADLLLLLLLLCSVLLLLLLFSQQTFRLLLSVRSVRLWFLVACIILSLTAGKSFCVYFWNAFKMFSPLATLHTPPLSAQPLAEDATVDLMLRFSHPLRPQRFVFVTNLTTIPTLTHTHRSTSNHIQTDRERERLINVCKNIETFLLLSLTLFYLFYGLFYKLVCSQTSRQRGRAGARGKIRPNSQSATCTHNTARYAYL